jgi:hypothetical protein
METSPDVSLITCCDREYALPSVRPRVSHLATYRSGTPQVQHPAVAQWQAHLHGLATAIHEISGLANSHPGEGCQELKARTRPKWWII